MSENLMDKVSTFSERLKVSGEEVGKKMTAGMSSMSYKMKEFFQGQNPANKFIEEATSETLEGPDWAINLEICDMMNSGKVNSVELIRSIKSQIMSKNPKVQYLALVLLETCVKNCEKAFSEVAAERVLVEMVKLIDDPQTIANNRNKALVLIEAWGESGNELRYLPVFEETYKSLKSRGIRFPGRDDESLAPIFTPPRSISESESFVSVNQQEQIGVHEQTLTPEQVKETFDVARNSIELLSTVLSSSPQQDALQDDFTTSLVHQCRECLYTIQAIIESTGEDEVVIFEALNVNDELQKVLLSYDDLKQPESVHSAPQPALIPVVLEHEESPRIREEALVRKPPGFRAKGGHVHDDDMMDDLDEMIFGKKGGSSSGNRDQRSKQQKDDFISF